VSAASDLRDRALDLMSSFVLEDGRMWGDAAAPQQWADARALLDPAARQPLNFNTRARGWSKTTDVSACTVAAMLVQAPPGVDLYAAASDRDQSALMRRAIEGFVERTPALAGRLRVDRWEVTAVHNNARLTMLAADASGAYGLKPWWLVIDELAAWPDTESARELWLALTSAMGKVPGSRMAVITSAGSPGHWSFEQLKHARSAPLWRVSEVDGPAPWMPADRLEEQRQRLLPSQFERLFLNRWTEGEDALVSAADLDAALCLDDWPLLPRPRTQYFVGCDLGLVRDRTAIAVCHAEPVTDGVGGFSPPPAVEGSAKASPVVSEVVGTPGGAVFVRRDIAAGVDVAASSGAGRDVFGRLSIEEERRARWGERPGPRVVGGYFDGGSLRREFARARWGEQPDVAPRELVEAEPARERAHRVVVDRLDVWQGSKSSPVSLEVIEAHLAMVAANFNHPRILIDPHQAAYLRERLRKRHVRIRDYQFSTSSISHLAVTLATLLRNRSISLPADDAELRDELANVRLLERSPGRIRMDHAAGRHDDRAIALALAAQAAVESIRSTGVVRIGHTKWR